MSDKVIGLELAYKTSNYGAQLQALATQHVIKRMGFHTKIINMKKSSFFDSHNIGPGLLYNSYLAYKSTQKRKKTRVDISDEVYLDNRSKRKEVSLRFIHDRLTDIVNYSSCHELTEDAKNMAAVLIGSDQKWLPGACYGKVGSLSFAPKGVRRISYATSLGVSEYPKYCWKMSRKMWNHIDYLSVREKQGADIIKQICGDIPVEVVVDPTYLLTKKEWEDLIPVKKMLGEPYLLCYFLGNNDDSKRCAKRFAEQNHLKLMSVLSDESYSPYDQIYADELVIGATPEEFVNWIRGAEYVFTDSFHGTAFSVINEKQFFVFYRKRLDAKQSRNSRIDNALSLWQLEDRLITDNDIEWLPVKTAVINYSHVNTILSSERERSLAFLTKALQFNEDK